jgi:hypothetical protein
VNKLQKHSKNEMDFAIFSAILPRRFSFKEERGACKNDESSLQHLQSIMKIGLGKHKHLCNQQRAKTLLPCEGLLLRSTCFVSIAVSGLGKAVQ